MAGDQQSYLSETLPDKVLKRYRLQNFRNSIFFLHQPPPDAPATLLQERTHSAWRRIKFDELLAHNSPCACTIGNAAMEARLFY